MATRPLMSGAESCNGGHDERLHEETVVADPSSLQPWAAFQQNGYRHQVANEMCTSLMLGGEQQEYSSEESALDHDPPSQMLGSLNRHSMSDSPSPTEGPPHTQTSAAACFHWPASSRLHGTAEERSAYFSGLQKTVVDPQIEPREPLGQQATTLLDLMTIRAFHTKDLRRFSIGTAVGFRTRGGNPTNTPAIIVFVTTKVHETWLHENKKLPKVLEGPGGIWCDVDVVEFSCDRASPATQKEQVHTKLAEALRGNDPCIGPGSQVASQETYGTLGAIVQSRTGVCQVGFLTNRHVAVNLDYPNQKMFHPMPPNLGQGVYLGAVERATSFITDDLWYGIFASTNPETFVRADGAFIPFADYFDISKVTTTVKGVGDIGDVVSVDLQAPIDSIVGKRVVKVGRSSGLTRGSIMAYALEYNDEKGICVFTDFLIIGGENGQAFDLEGDSGSLILLDSENGEKPRPVGIIWGGTSNRGRVKLRKGDGPENWTIGVDLGKLLDRLQLELITNDRDLKDAVEDDRNYWNPRFGMGSTMAESSSVMALGLETERAEVSRSAYIEEMPSFSLCAQPRNQDVIGEDNLLVGALGHREWLLNLEPDSSSSPATQIEVTDCGSGLEAKRKGKEPDISHASNEGCEDLSAGFDFFERESKRRKHKTCMFFI